MLCPRCRAEIRDGLRFCEDCGSRLTLTCAQCGGELAPGKRFCGSCGASAAGESAARTPSPESYTPKHLAEKILTSKAALEGERKQVTVLFADLKGSMELLADRDPEEARKLLDPVLEHMMEAVHRYEGTVNQVMGDGIMALFGAPLGHEDHAVRACAALDMQTAMRRHAEEVRRSHGLSLEIRVGLNSGEVVVRAIGSDLHMDYTAVGQTTHLAARMEQLATGGRSLLTADTLRLVEGYVDVKSLGPVPVKGLEAAIEVYEILGAGPLRSRLHAAAARGLTRFVGRETEVEQLRQALGRAATGRGQLAALVGEPGVGKSRLVWEVIHSHRTHGWLTVQASSVSYGKATPYLPVIDLLKGYLRIQDQDDPRAVREKVTGKLLTLDEALKPTVPAFLALLDVPVDDAAWSALDPPQRRQRTLEAAKRLLLRESQVQPLLVVFEDLHWVDGETQAFLDSLVESLPAARMLLLVNYRPEYTHRWGSKTYYTQLRLDPLPPESAESLLDALLGSDPALRPLKHLLIDRTEGNPFFLEESVRTLVETKVLAGERGAYRLAQTLPSIQVPATVQAILAARIDRLAADQKHLLQAAAVIGKDVSFVVLQAIAEVPEDVLRRGLASLQAGEFLHEVRLFPDLEYTFKHALTHEVAYGSLLQDRRRALHARIVEAIEALYPDRLPEQVERLAHHAVQGQVWTKAAAYLHQAGAKALARSAHQEAVTWLEQAREVTKLLPETRDSVSEAIDLQIALGTALVALKGAGAPEVEVSFAQARDLCRQLQDTSRLFPALWGLWRVKNYRGESRASRDLAERLLEVARDGQDPERLLHAHHALWTALLNTGEPASAIVHLERGLALYDPRQHRSHVLAYGGHDPGVCGHGTSAWTLWLLGYADQALNRVDKALNLARELSHPFTTHDALMFAAWLHYDRGESSAAAETVEAVMTIASAHGFPVWEPTTLMGRIMVEQGRGEEGLTQLHRGLTGLRAAGSRVIELRCLCLLIDAYRKQRQPDRGLGVLSEASELAEENVNVWFESERHRLKGELLLDRALDTPQDSEACFRRAIDIARVRNMKSLELRAVMSLSRLVSREGRDDEARTILAEVYGWFSEGFDTRDLREAKALLEELRR
jgi:class 3 adenylate cyclase/predicted ATPase